MRTQSYLQKTCDYLDTHLYQDIRLSEVSQQVGCATSHLQRQFKKSYDMTIGQYIRYARLKRAAYFVLYRQEMSLLEIALTVQFQSAAGFSRAFRHYFGISPSQVRSLPAFHPDIAVFRQRLTDRIGRAMTPKHFSIEDISYQEMPEVSLIALRHSGDIRHMDTTIQTFIKWRQQQKLSAQSYETYNLFYQDPGKTPPAQFFMDLAVDPKQRQPDLLPGMSRISLPAGTYLSYRHCGTEAALSDVIGHISAYCQSLSGWRVVDFPLCLKRHRFFPDVAETEAETEILILLEKE